MQNCNYIYINEMSNFEDTEKLLLNDFVIIWLLTNGGLTV